MPIRLLNDTGARHLPAASMMVLVTHPATAFRSVRSPAPKVGSRCWACVTAHRSPACEALMCRPAHVSGSVAGLSPCHGLPLHAGRACADQHQCRCRFSRHRAAPTAPRRGCQPLGLIRRTRCVKELRARRDRLALSQLLRETFPAPPPASAWLALVSLGLGGFAALGSIKHDVFLRVNTMFKQICNFARPGVAQAQKNRPKAVGWGVCDLPLGAVPLPRRHRH